MGSKMLKWRNIDIALYYVEDVGQWRDARGEGGSRVISLSYFLNDSYETFLFNIIIIIIVIFIIINCYHYSVILSYLWL